MNKTIIAAIILIASLSSCKLLDTIGTTIEQDPQVSNTIELVEDSLGAITPIWPAAGGLLLLLEGSLTLFSKRKKRHYSNAIKAIVPYNGKVDIPLAISSVVRALGAAHTSKESKEASNRMETFNDN